MQDFEKGNKDIYDINNVENSSDYPKDLQRMIDSQKRKSSHKCNQYFSGMFTGGILAFIISFLVIVLTLVLFIRTGFIKIGNGGNYVNSQVANDSDGIGSTVKNKLNTLETFLEKYFYFDDVEDDKAADAIFKAYMEAYGDKYTVYYTAEEYKSILENTSGKFYGIGAVCQKVDDGAILALQVYENSPASKAGLKENDKIYKVDGEDVTQMDLTSAVKLIKGDKDTFVELEIKRNEETLTIKAQRDEVEEITVEHKMLEDNIGYILIDEFDDVTTKQFKEAVTSLENQGMESLVIDVRYNPGGVLSVVIEILDYLLEDGEYVYTQDSQGNIKKYSGSDNYELDIPIAVLVNGSSASAAEIFAGVMQDYDKAEIIGTTTYGKGIVQSIQPLSDGSAIKYTIAKYFTSKKKQDVHGNGIKPDRTVELPENSQSDTQLDAAIEYLKNL